MTDAKRSTIGRKAYNDFIESLAEIQQLSPVQSEFTGAGAPKDTTDIPEGLTIEQLADKANWYSMMLKIFCQA